MKKIKLIARIIMILLLLVHAGCMSTESNARGGLSGSVTDTYGTPLSGVTVATTEASTVSDVNGRWVLSELSVQTTQVTASREKYQTQSVSVEVLSGETVAGVAFVLPADGDIYDIQVTAVTSTTARAVFYTKMATRGHVRYGVNAMLEQSSPADNENKFFHQFELSGLVPGSTYRIQCLAVDSAGRNLSSEIKTFTTVSTVRPEAPQGLKLSKIANSNIIKLDWSRVDSADSAGYKVYRAFSAQGPFNAIGSVNQNYFSDNDVTPGVKYYYRVTQIAGSGDESSPSSVASFVMPGVVSQNIVWVAQESPYLLSGSITIPPGMSLMIDKGVAVNVARQNLWDSDETGLPGLNIQGTLVIQGTDDAPVVMTSSESTPQAGAWGGIKFDVMSDIGASSIKGLHLSFAETGINGLSGVPEIKNSRFFNCSKSAVQTTSARSDILLENLQIDTCASGMLIRENNVNVKILNNQLMRCVYGIVCRDNLYALIEGNRISFSGVSGIDVGNQQFTSVVRRNLVGYGSNGTGLICRGNDEIRRNTLHAAIGMEIRDTAVPVIRSNLILADKAKNGIGIMFTGAVAYNASTATNTITIQNNAVWNLTDINKKYANSDGTNLPASLDLAMSAASGPGLQGGDPFLEFPNLNFSYVPAPDSVLKGNGYDFETIGAENVPD